MFFRRNLIKNLEVTMRPGLLLEAYCTDVATLPPATKAKVAVQLGAARWANTSGHNGLRFNQPRHPLRFFVCLGCLCHICAPHAEYVRSPTLILLYTTCQAKSVPVPAMRDPCA